MNPTLWLLIAIASTLALALAIAYLVARNNEAKSAPEYRTADGGVIEADVQALQQLVPSPRPRVRAGTYKLSQVAVQGVTAALRDMGAHKSTPNPYPTSTVEHAHWEHHYQRVRASATAADREAQQAHADE